jgi:hypothetical protein
VSDRRNIDDDYKQAMIREWEAYAASGRSQQADHVAEVLLAEYDYDVHAAGKKQETAAAEAAPENTAATKPPETAVEPKPETAARPRAAAKKTAAPKTS